MFRYTRRRMRTLRVLVPCALAMVLLAQTAAAAVPPRPWRSAGRVDPAPPVKLSCPSSSLCVAIDGRGNVSSSTDPEANVSVWTVTNVDPPGELDGLSCPSVALCVAVDARGNVLTSVDPASGPGTWTSTPVRSGGVSDVSCPATTLCVAVGGPDVAFSHDPGAGTSAWTVVRNVDTTSGGPECGKYGGTDGCYSPNLASISCSSVAFCEALGTEGGAVRSSDPGSAQGWPPQGYEATGDYAGPVVCPADGKCLGQCVVGAGLNGSNCTGTAYDSGNVLSWGGSETISPSPILGLWCVSLRLCFAGDEAGHLLVSTEPGNPSIPWSTVYSTHSASANEYDPVAAVACPSASLCVALDYLGNLITGSPPTPTIQLQAALRAALTPSGQPRIGRLIRQRAYFEGFEASVPGRLTISWYQAGTHSLLAHASVFFRTPGMKRFAVRLTRTGVRVLSHATRVELTLTGRFLPAGGPAVRATGHFRLTA